jgi:low affinity Fe/Cu permease
MLEEYKPIPASDGIKLIFRKFAEKTSRFMGSPLVFGIAVCSIALWGLLGFYFGFSDTWQLMINTATTIGTFLIVILIQNTQNRESRSIQLKLDELLRGTKNTRDSLMEIEEESDEELDRLKEEFHKTRERYLIQLEKRRRKRQ